MFTDLQVLAFLFFIFLVVRIACDMWVIHHRLRIPLRKKLFGVSLLATLITIAMAAQFLNYIPLQSGILLICNLLLISGVEAPIYQIFYPQKPWRSFFINLLLARLLFSIVLFVLALVGARMIS